MAWIRITGSEGSRDVQLVAHNTLGRHPNNSIQLLDRIVSKEHCHIDYEGEIYVLKDLGSLNGTFVNGMKVDRHRLQPGDSISVGSTTIVFSDETVEVPPPSLAPDLPIDATIEDVQDTPREPASSRVTMTPGMVESYIRTKFAAARELNFLHEKLIEDQAILRADYEKLRAGYELARSIGIELDVDRLLSKILDSAFQLLDASRGVVLLCDEQGELKPRCVRVAQPKDAEVDVILSTTIINEVLKEKVAILSNDASVDSRFHGAHSIIMQGIRSTMAVPLIHSDNLFGIMLLDSQVAANAFTEKDLQLFQNIANQAAIFIQNSLYAKKLEEEAITRQRFQRLLSPAIAEQVLTGNVEIAKGGEIRETTTLFSDIRGFTSMSEAHSPQEIVDMLNEYFELMVEIIFKNEGTLDKFVGDAIMALFGAPVAHHDDPYRAVKTALEMLDALDEFNVTRHAAGQEPIEIGIGVNTGEAVAGYLGSSKALEYTVIGDAVNISSRLCAVAKPGEILISEHTFARVQGRFEIIEKPTYQLKGKTKTIKIYQVMRPSVAQFEDNERTRPGR